MANGVECQKALLSESNNWEYTFVDLLESTPGVEMEYSVLEDMVPEFYSEEYYGNVDDGFVIRNILPHGDTDVPDEPVIPNLPHNNPHTADSITSYIFMLFMSMIGFVSFAFSTKKNYKARI